MPKKNSLFQFSEQHLKIWLIAVLVVSIGLVLMVNYRYQQLRQQVNLFNQRVDALRPGDNAATVTYEFLKSVGY